MKLIDKDIIINELKTRINLCDKFADAAAEYNLHNSLEANELLICEYERIISFLNTLEVKEVDFENYIHGTIDYPIIGSDFPNIYPNYKELKNYCDKNRIMDNDKVRLIMIKEDMP